MASSVENCHQSLPTRPNTHVPIAEAYEPPPNRPSSRDDFEIAIICALTVETDAALALFDWDWDKAGLGFGKLQGDKNEYNTGVIGSHNVVLAHMPEPGNANAARVAANCQFSFPQLKLALIVGVCGAVPFWPTSLNTRPLGSKPGSSKSPSGRDEIVLGDVIISDGIMHYDFGRLKPGGQYERKNLLGRPSIEMRALLKKTKAQENRQQLREQMIHALGLLQSVDHLTATYPTSINDWLFKAAYRHVKDGESCDRFCSKDELLLRNRVNAAKGNPNPQIHVGLIASGDSVVMSGEERDALSASDGIIAFEMEAAGVWESIPCVVIKGACDYADSHKNKNWQSYAAATAASCMKAFLTSCVSSVPSGYREEIQSALSEAEQQKKDSKEILQRAEGRTKANELAMMGLSDGLLSFLLKLALRTLFSADMTGGILSRIFDDKRNLVQSIIDSDEKIVSMLEKETESTRETLILLEAAREILQERDGSPRRTSTDEEGQPPIIEDVTSGQWGREGGSSRTSTEQAKQQRDDNSTLTNREEQQYTSADLIGSERKHWDGSNRPSIVRVEKHHSTAGSTSIQAEPEVVASLQDNLRRVQQQVKKLQRTLEEISAAHIRANARYEQEKAKLAEAEKIRLENESKTVRIQIWAWIKWLASCGQN